MRDEGLKAQAESHAARRRLAADKLAALAARVTLSGRRWREGQLSRRGGVRRRLENLEARVQHLDAELEGLQDAVYRRALKEDEHIAELRRRTEPGQVARDLSEDARRRGL